MATHSYPETNQRTLAEAIADSARLIDQWIRERHEFPHPAEGKR
ncbi:hypothetical protein [Curtobacterium sp. MCBD17_040]|nr:hypothetical protein [Curtobacterium sp. MCBD17_040]WIB64379.1 hypothetical protein DEI94_04060 [Curtobacterium sp. MCBD17_040]